MAGWVRKVRKPSPARTSTYVNGKMALAVIRQGPAGHECSANKIRSEDDTCRASQVKLFPSLWPMCSLSEGLRLCTEWEVNVVSLEIHAVRVLNERIRYPAVADAKPDRHMVNKRSTGNLLNLSGRHL